MVSAMKEKYTVLLELIIGRNDLVLDQGSLL